MHKAASVIGTVGLLLAGCGQIRSDVGAMFEGGGGLGPSAGAEGATPAPSSAGGSTGNGVGEGAEAGAGAGDGTRGGAGNGGRSMGGGSPVAPTAISLSGAPIYTRVQRLTRSQWENSVRDILRLEAAPVLAATEPLFVEPTAEFSNNERRLYVDLETANAFQAAAEAAAELATASEQQLALLPTGDRDEFVRTLGRRAFRRPLTDAEEARYQAVFARGEELYGAGFANGAALVIRAMLQSPLFLYRSELGGTGEPLTGYEVASKLSFLLLDTTPSDALLDRAAAGDLDTPDALEAIAREMLEDAAAPVVMRSFHGQLYELDAYAKLEKDGEGFTPSLRDELATVSYAFFDAVFARGEGLTSILTSPHGFVGPNTAPLYGMESPQMLEERELGEDRIGYFLQVPFLMRGSYTFENASAPIRRGMSLWRQVLCPPVLAPPSGAVPEAPEPLEGATTREWLTEFTSGCGGPCHNSFLNPLGFAFESFDGMGRARELDNGKPVDASGSYLLPEGTVTFRNARELLENLASSTEAHLCYAKKLAGYALQRDIIASDWSLLEGLARVSRTSGIKDEVVALVRDPAFRLRQEGSQ